MFDEDMKESVTGSRHHPDKPDDNR